MKNLKKRINNLLKSIGPGFVTGSADDDPSGVATYSIAGAQFGYRLAWMSLFLIPLMIAVQEMCGKIGLVSGKGLAGVIKHKYPKGIPYLLVTLLALANIFNISADLGIMAECLGILTHFSFLFWLVVITIITVLLEILVPYKKYSLFLKWLGLFLLVYVVTAFIVPQNWGSVVYHLFIPTLSFDKVYLIALMGFAGTTISPYLFFWQAGEEVEEEINSHHVSDFNHKPLVATKDIKYLRRDTTMGMVYSSVIALFIVLTTASALHTYGVTEINTPAEAALALKPLAGNFAFLIFSLGIIGIGLQAIPILAGGVAYAVAESFGWKEGLSKNFIKAKGFYFVLGISVLVGALFNLFKIEPITALFYASVFNGLVSVPLIYIVLKLCRDPKVVGKYQTKGISYMLGIAAFVFMLFASLLLIWQLFS